MKIKPAQNIGVYFIKGKEHVTNNMTCFYTKYIW